MKAKIITTTIAFTITLFTLIIFLNVLSGNIGNKENWRIIFSFIGFIIFLIATGLSVYSIIRSNLA